MNRNKYVAGIVINLRVIVWAVVPNPNSEVQNNITINWELLVDLFIETRLYKFLIFFVFLASGIFPDKSRSVGN